MTIIKHYYPFTLDDWKAGAELRTRDGRPVEVVCVDNHPTLPVVGRYLDEEKTRPTLRWQLDGRSNWGVDSHDDLKVYEEEAVDDFQLKYETTGQVKTLEDGTEVRRIVALRDFKNPLLTGDKWVRRGDLGGWIESVSNLDHRGSAWVAGEAVVSGGAQVKDNALVEGNAHVFGNAKVITSAHVSDFANVYGSAFLCGSAKVGGQACIREKAWLRDRASVYAGEVSGLVTLQGDTCIVTSLLLCGGGTFEIVQGGGAFERFQTLEDRKED